MNKQDGIFSTLGCTDATIENGIVMDLNDLHAFALVAQHGTISAAAAQLKVPKSTVSRRVQRLEDDLGVELLRRSPRSVSLTDDGLALHRRASPALRDLLESSDALSKHQIKPSGRLRITTVPDFGQTAAFTSLIKDYVVSFPDVTIDVDFSFRSVNLVEEGFDVAFRLHPRANAPDASLIARHVAKFRGGFYVSPDYSHPKGIPKVPADVAHHRLSVSSAYPGLTYLRDLLQVGPGYLPNWTVNDFAVPAQIAAQGEGVALLATFAGEPLVTQGKLMRILPDCELPTANISLIWPASRHLTPRVQTFVEHAVRLVDEVFE